MEAPSSSSPGGFSLCWEILNIQIHLYAVVEGARLPLRHANERQGLSPGTGPSPRHFPQVAPWSQGGLGGDRGSFLGLPRGFLHLLLSGRRGESSHCFLRAGGNDIFKCKEEEVKHWPRPALSSLGVEHPQGWGAQHLQGWGAQGCRVGGLRAAAVWTAALKASQRWVLFLR